MKDANQFYKHELSTDFTLVTYSFFYLTFVAIYMLSLSGYIEIDLS